MKKFLTFLCCFFIFGNIIYAQNNIKGKITDANGIPLPSVTIKSVKTGKVVASQADGTFTINTVSDDELILTSIGFNKIQVAANSNLNIIMVNSIEELGQVVLIGTRGAPRAKIETAVPVDVIKINQAGLPTAKTDLTSVLNYAAPSFNYNKQSGADGADHVDLGTLRGLGPDQTLVLINGKRRHQTAFVALFGTRGRGNSGVDLNAFPESAVDRLEILRDGAAAQYGSDAIAGVINIILKKDINKWNVNAGWSGYFDHKFNSLNSYDRSQYYTGHQIDGGTLSLGINNGFALGKKGGFINVSLNFLNQAKTYREVPDTNVMKNPNALPLNNARRAFGDGSVTTGGVFINMEAPVCKKSTFYAFGGYNYKASDAFAYTRNWSLKPNRFPVDANGNLIFVHNIMHISSDGETFYNPHIQTQIGDVSIATGVKGTLNNGWNWDLSNALGRNNFHYYGDQTFNVSHVGYPTQTHFDDGGFNFLQNTVNLDFSKSIKTIAQGLNIGIGAEYRYEQYGIFKGEEASYKNYDITGAQAGGSQGFPGFSPSDEVKGKRTNEAIYADLELNATQAWLIDGALRFENYSDFGSVITGKLATRLKITPKFNLRGSVSTGFRAPSLQQIYFSNTLTSFSGGQLVQSRIFNNNDSITRIVGIPALKQETSVNGSVGFTFKPISGFSITVDGYMVKIKNRVILSGLFSAGDATLSPIFQNALNNNNISTAQFFANAVSTTNYGLDVVLDYTKKWGIRKLTFLLAGNVNSLNVDQINYPPLLNDSYLHRKTFFSDREEAFLKASAPKAKFTLNTDYSSGKWGTGMHITYFGNEKFLGFGWTGLASKAGSNGPGDPSLSGSFTGIDPYVDVDGYNDQVHVVKEIFNQKGKIVVDVYGSNKITKHASLFFGIDNIFNAHPNLSAVQNARYEALDNESGGPWDSVQMGFNGRRVFAKISISL